MYDAAEWLERGDDRHQRTFDIDSSDEQAQPDGAGIGAAIAKLWVAGYKQVVFVGHSMGAGVAVLTALKVAHRFRELEIKVYGYGIPACVDETLAEALKGKRARGPGVPWLGKRVTCKSIIRHDDVVPRLSILTARGFAMELQETRSRWGPLLTEDIASFTSRLKTVWAPTQRAHALSRGGPSERVPLEKSQAVDDKKTVIAVDLHKSLSDEATFEKLKKSLVHRLVPPGIIVHTYKHNGAHRAAVVDFNFPPLRRIEASQDCIDDHRFESILRAVRSVRAVKEARLAGRCAPHWESLRDHMNEEGDWQVKCSVCCFPVSWASTSRSEHHEVRSTHHCHACGKICCSKCSENRIALPSLGFLNQERVCDACFGKLGVVEPNGASELMLSEPGDW